MPSDVIIINYKNNSDMTYSLSQTEISALMGYCAASIDSNRRFGTTYWSQKTATESQDISDISTLEDGTDTLSRNVGYTAVKSYSLNQNKRIIVSRCLLLYAGHACLYSNYNFYANIGLIWQIFLK
jgi:hypothetical protein